MSTLTTIVIILFGALILKNIYDRMKDKNLIRKHEKKAEQKTLLQRGGKL